MSDIEYYKIKDIKIFEYDKNNDKTNIMDFYTYS